MAKVFRANNITYSPFEMDMTTEDVKEDLKREVGNEHSSEWLIDWIVDIELRDNKLFWGKSSSMAVFVVNCGKTAAQHVSETLRLPKGEIDFYG